MDAKVSSIKSNLNFKKIDYKKFPVTKIINSLPQNDALYETALVSANDKLVDLFLKKKNGNNLKNYNLYTKFVFFALIVKWHNITMVRLSSKFDSW